MCFMCKILAHGEPRSMLGLLPQFFPVFTEGIGVEFQCLNLTVLELVRYSQKFSCSYFLGARITRVQHHASPSTMLPCSLFWGAGGGGPWQVWNFLCNLGCPQTKRIRLPLPECLGIKALTTRSGPAFYFEAESFTEPQAHQLRWRD